jgi:hypothetical protein
LHYYYVYLFILYCYLKENEDILNRNATDTTVDLDFHLYNKQIYLLEAMNERAMRDAHRFILIYQTELYLYF